MNKKIKNVNVDNQSPGENEISENTENLFKLILRVMTWIAGICFLLIIFLHLFNSETLDSISKFLYYIAIIILISFTVIEFNADKFKLKLQQYRKVSS